MNSTENGSEMRMKLKEKLTYFLFVCVFVVIGQVLLNIIIPMVMAQEEAVTPKAMKQGGIKFTEIVTVITALVALIVSIIALILGEYRTKRSRQEEDDMWKLYRQIVDETGGNFGVAIEGLEIIPYKQKLAGRLVERGLLTHSPNGKGFMLAMPFS